MKKRLVILLSTIFCTLSFIIGVTCNHDVCYATEDISGMEDLQTASQPVDKKTIEENAKNLLENFYYYWSNTDFELVKGQLVYQYAVGYGTNIGDEDENVQMLKDWKKLREEAGKASGITENGLKETKAGYEAFAIAKYEKCSLKFTAKYNKNGQIVSDVKVEKYVSKEGKASIKTALINTVMSITIVFVVLIFIAFVISLLKFVPKLVGLEKKETKPEEKAAPVVVEEVEEDVTDDTELVAVITAAIMASMGDEAPADGLVISSIKRRNASKWKTR